MQSRALFLPSFTVLVALAASPFTGTLEARDRAMTVDAPPTTPAPNVAQYHPDLVLHGGQPRGFAKGFADSFNIYGGVRSDGSNDRRADEGSFQTFILAPVNQGWFGVDRTENPTFWHVSSFNASNLDPAAGNRAMWSGVEADAQGFQTAPGYGNSWNDQLDWRAQTNPTLNTQVRLQLVFNHDTEPGYDFFVIEYDSAGTMIPWLALDGTNKNESGVFETPVSFDQTVLFTPLMYTGTPRADVHLRLRVSSDGAWSDEDGLWPTRGAAQIDNVRVYFNTNLVTANGNDGVATFEDLGGVDDTEGWEPISSEFAGDFAKVLAQLRDIDPCRQNLTPQLGFIDDGTVPANASESTGGTLSINWSYGIRGGWVVNYNGGISFAAVPLYNEFWSPEIAWDDTSSTGDDGLVGGAFMRFGVWQHLPLQNGMFWLWSVRSQDEFGWTPWQNRNFVYYGDGGGTYTNVQTDVTDLISPARSKVQMSLGVIDLAGTFAFPGNDATPSPTFDNVSFWRYNLGGPAFSTRNIDLFQDGFPNSGSLDWAGDPTSLSIRVDMARDVSTGSANVPGDSIIVDVSPTVPGSSLAALPVMRWLVEANPQFDPVRIVPAGSTEMGPSARGWSRWMGTVNGDSSRTSAGAAIADRFFFDMPHEGPANTSAPYQSDEPPFFFPGDRLRYFIEATDTEGNTTTLPADTTGFMSGQSYSRVFTVRGLPSLVPDGLGGVEQPDILVINDFGHRGGENEFLSAFQQNGLFEDDAYEVYTVRGPSSLVSNGIGSAGAHGANADQLAGYSVLVYLSGNLSDGLISDGTNLNGNDKGNDVQTLSQWHDKAGDRFMVHFGDDLASFLATSGPATQAYLATIMAVDLVDNDVRDELDGQAVTLVEPSGLVVGSFAQPFVAYGGCLGVNRFDSIRPASTPGATTGHRFVAGLGGTPFIPSASVWHERTVNIGGNDYARVDISFPFGFSYIYDVISKAPANVSARSVVLGEILQAFGQQLNPGSAVGTPALTSGLRVEGNVPNPFNPSTVIRFQTPARGPLTVRVYNLRGELVRELWSGEIGAGAHELRWDGNDLRGAEVSSGVYLYELNGFGSRHTAKMTLLK